MKATFSIFVFVTIVAGNLGSECGLDTCRLGHQMCVRPPHVNSEADSYCLECSKKRSKCGTNEQMEGCHLFCQDLLQEECAAKMDRLNASYTESIKRTELEIRGLESKNEDFEQQKKELEVALWSLGVVAGFLSIVVVGLIRYLVTLVRNKRNGSGQLDPERDPDETSRMVLGPAAPVEPQVLETSTLTGPETPMFSPSNCPGYRKLTQMQPTETTAEITYAIG